MLRLLLIVACLQSLSACVVVNRGCDTSAVSGIDVTVVDSSTGARICDAAVIARQGAQDEPLSQSSDPNGCTYVGAYERSGTFDVSVTKAGFLPASQVVTVLEGDCHVITQSLVISLKR
jgi:hypothetical protein